MINLCNDVYYLSKQSPASHKKVIDYNQSRLWLSGHKSLFLAVVYNIRPITGFFYFSLLLPYHSLALSCKITRFSGMLRQFLRLDRSTFIVPITAKWWTETRTKRWHWLGSFTDITHDLLVLVGKIFPTRNGIWSNENIGFLREKGSSCFFKYHDWFLVSILVLWWELKVSFELQQQG